MLKEKTSKKPSVLTASATIRHIKTKYVCDRCMRSLSRSQEKFSQGLYNFYKSICKSSNCTVHKKKSKCRVKKNVRIHKKKGKCRKKMCTRRKIPRVVDPKIPCLVEEFQEDEYSEEKIDPLLYEKIAATVSEYDAIRAIKMENLFCQGALKELITRTIVWPLTKPDLFKGLRSAPKGVLLFGPPGAGKTVIGQCIALETQSTFFNVSSSLLTSKWMGESEKLVRTMFIVAKARQPSVIFIDEVDSILSKRTPEENGSSRRMKNEFLIQMDGATTLPHDKILVVGATNRPQELDEAARRRFVKRLYVSFPDEIGRKELLVKLLERECHSLEEIDINDIVRKTEGYSIADLKNLCQEAAMGPIKSLTPGAIINLKPNKIRPISVEDFLWALQLIKPSISKEEVKEYEEWDILYGYGGELKKKPSDESLAGRQKASYFQNSTYVT